MPITQDGPLNFRVRKEHLPTLAPQIIDERSPSVSEGKGHVTDWIGTFEELILSRFVSFTC
jgi:hypothetical protein